MLKQEKPQRIDHQIDETDIDEGRRTGRARGRHLRPETETRGEGEDHPAADDEEREHRKQRRVHQKHRNEQKRCQNQSHQTETSKIIGGAISQQGVYCDSSR